MPVTCWHTRPQFSYLFAGSAVGPEGVVWETTALRATREVIPSAANRPAVSSTGNGWAGTVAELIALAALRPRLACTPPARPTA